MPLGTNVAAALDLVPTPPSDTVVTAEVKSKWVQIIDNGGLETQDNVAITNPTAHITNSTTHIFVTGGRGTKLYVRMKYDDEVVLSTDPVFRIYGRHSSGDTHWQLLFNDNATPSPLITCLQTSGDITDGTDMWSDIGLVVGEVSLSTLGCDEFLVGVQTAAAASAGDATLTTLEAKVV